MTIRDLIVILLALAALGPSVGPVDGAVGTAIIAGRANYADEALGPRYLAIRSDRGTRVEVCGAGGCWRTHSTDYGPDIDTGDIADIAFVHFLEVCGYTRDEARTYGECDVMIEYLGDIDLPPTDMERDH